MPTSAADQHVEAVRSDRVPQRRALSGRIIDLIRDGAPIDAIKSHGHDPAVWSALVSSAMSAVNRGWSAPDFVTLVLEPKSHLGSQASLKKGKNRGRAQTTRLVYDAWDRAQENVKSSPAWTAGDLHQRAQERQARSAHALKQVGLTEAEQLVMRHVARRLSEAGSLQRAISRQDFIDETGLGKTALETAQRRLMTRGLLVQIERGAPSGPKAGKRRAHVWALPDGQASTSAEVLAGEPHSSNTGNRYVAPTPTKDATTCGVPACPADVGLGELPSDLAVRQLLRLLEMASAAPDSREVLLLSWPRVDERESRES